MIKYIVVATNKVDGSKTPLIIDEFDGGLYLLNDNSPDIRLFSSEKDAWTEIVMSEIGYEKLNPKKDGWFFNQEFSVIRLEIK
jgi:hypothetical protein